MNKVAKLHQGPIERVAVRIPAEGVADICPRIFGIEAELKCIASALDNRDADIHPEDFGLAVRAVAAQINHLYLDLDVASWPAVES